MQRVLVIGAGGSGKSTVARRLGERTGLPVLHLDAHYWRPGWVKPSELEWNATVERLLAGERWIMDGNYGGSREARIAACDTVLFLDLPRTVCLRRVILRRLRLRGRTRPDMAPGCPERLTWDFLWWIWTYRARRRPGILRRLRALRPDQTAVVLRSDREIDAFLDGLRQTPASAPDKGIGGSERR